jgi:superfamily II helicase
MGLRSIHHPVIELPKYTMTEAPLNPAQQEVSDFGLLSSGFSCVLQMPTGSGKTWLAKKAIRRSVQLGFRALYLTPLRAPAEELVTEWVKEFDGIEVGIFTGDYGRGGVAFPTPYREARVLIMTPERMDVCTRTWRSHWNWIPEVDLVVVDEVHLLGYRGRRTRLEGAFPACGASIRSAEFWLYQRPSAIVQNWPIGLAELNLVQSGGPFHSSGASAGTVKQIRNRKSFCRRPAPWSKPAGRARSLCRAEDERRPCPNS